MVDEQENAYKFQKIWKSLVIWLTTKSGWTIGGVRKDIELDSQSDIYMDFWIDDSYEKHEVYNDLIPKLRSTYPGSQVVKGGGQNTIMFVYDGLKIDLNLLFKQEYMEKLDKRK